MKQVVEYVQAVHECEKEPMTDRDLAATVAFVFLTPSEILCVAAYSVWNGWVVGLFKRFFGPW